MSERTLTIPCKADGAVLTVSAPLMHRCPFSDGDFDEGRVELRWIADGMTLELHALRHWLTRFADKVMTHEECTGAIRDDLSALDGIELVGVLTTWKTAGCDVEVVCSAGTLTQ